jgi:hypothetical protein
MLRVSARFVRICKARPAFGKFETAEDKQVKAITVKPKKAGCMSP